MNIESRLYRLLLRFICYRYKLRTWKYDPPLDPFKLGYVDPTDIEFITGRGEKPYKTRFNDIGLVCDGDWDQTEQITPISANSNVHAVTKRFAEGKEWDNIDYIQSVKESVQQGNSRWHGCETVKEVNARCDHIDELYTSIREQGYKTQFQIAKEEGLDFKNPLRLLDEVAVDVGRDGELLLVDGTHRLGIARALELDQIPVLFIARHPVWMRKRAAASEGTYSQPHPDLTEIT